MKQQIDRLINNLIPETHLQDQFGSPVSLAERMAYHFTPGVALAIIQDYEVVWAGGFGWRDIETQEPVTAETLFQAGSISKPVFALAVMRLVEQGILNLDEDVNHYLTSWKVPTNGNWQPRLTLRQLLSHTAGLTAHGFPGYSPGQTLPTIPQILDGVLPANTEPVRVNILPGMQIRYSGGGTTIAQQVVVDVLGKPFPDIMQELIFEPLGLIHSTYQNPLPDEWAMRAATAHPWNNQPLAGKWYVYPEMAAAGLWTTPSDLARIGIEVQYALQGDTNRLISPETAHQMLTSQVPDGDKQTGIGFFMAGKEAGIRFGHGGWDEGFVADMTLYKEGGLGSVIMLNSNQGHPLMFEIQRAIARAYNWPDYFPQEKTILELPPSLLDAYAGEYRMQSGREFHITHESATLLLQTGGQAAVPFVPEEETKFFTRMLNASLTFEKTAENTITSLTLHQEGKQFRAEKVISNDQG